MLACFAPSADPQTLTRYILHNISLLLRIGTQERVQANKLLQVIRNLPECMYAARHGVVMVHK